MPDRVLIDTSVWIDLLRTARATEKIEALLSERRAAVCGLIVTELLRGAKGKKEVAVLGQLLDVVSYVHIAEEIYEQAGRLGSVMANRGFSIATVDLVIAQTCITGGLTLFSYDTHFQQVAKYEKLRLVA